MGYSDMSRRREKRLSELKKKYDSPKSARDYKKEEELHKSFRNKLYAKTLLSILLFVAVYFVFQSPQPTTKRVQELISDVMTKEYNFKGLYAIYKDNFSGNPAILPTFSSIKEEKEGLHYFSAPISSKPSDIRKTEKGIIVKMDLYEPVYAIERGLIFFADYDDGLGNTIMIRHENGIEATYALLDKLQVDENDWIEKGEVLGFANKEFYLAIKQQNKFINPLDVIRFD